MNLGLIKYYVVYALLILCLRMLGVPTSVSKHFAHSPEDHFGHICGAIDCCDADATCGAIGGANYSCSQAASHAASHQRWFWPYFGMVRPSYRNC